MSLEQNKEMVRRFYEAFNRADPALLESVLAPDAVAHTPASPTGRVEGVAGFRQIYDGLQTAFPDQHTELHELTAEDDRVVVRHTHRATNTGPFMGMPATGRAIVVDGIEQFRLRDGRIAEFWHQDDFLGLMQQLGAIPAPGAPGA